MINGDALSSNPSPPLRRGVTVLPRRISSAQRSGLRSPTVTKPCRTGHFPSLIRGSGGLTVVGMQILGKGPAIPLPAVMVSERCCRRGIPRGRSTWSTMPATTPIALPWGASIPNSARLRGQCLPVADGGISVAKILTDQGVDASAFELTSAGTQADDGAEMDPRTVEQLVRLNVSPNGSAPTPSPPTISTTPT
jgi:hypothetical protein